MLRPVNFDAVRDVIGVEDALDLIEWRATTREPTGLRGPCPFHTASSSRSRSLKVTARQWYCHKCKVGGDVIRLWGKLKGLSDLHAALELCRLMNIDPPRL